MVAIISAKVQTVGISARFAELDRDIALNAQRSALNKLAAQGRTQMSRAIRDEFALTKAQVDEKLSIATARVVGDDVHMQAAIESRGRGGRRAINLINFRPRVRMKVIKTLATGNRWGRKRQFVTVQVLKTKPRVAAVEAFVGNKGRTLFRRAGPDRLPIEPVQVIDVPQMFNTRRVNKIVTDWLAANAARVFEAEARYFMRRGAR